MRLLKATVIISAIAMTSTALADPEKGFHEGPYLRFIGGVVSATFDNNARTGEKTANDYEGTFGIQFGWHLWDQAGPELELRYATKKAMDSREHIVNVNLNVKYSFITDALTNLGSLHILPFIQGGPAALLAAVPGDSLANDRLMFVWGLGIGGGAGVDFLVAKYLYFGLLIQADLLYIPGVYQNIDGTRHKIIAGGWEPVLGILGAAGVHF